MTCLSAITSDNSSFPFQQREISIREEFKCAFSHELLIHPIKINCLHVFEKIQLIEILRISRFCPICHRRIEKAINDVNLARKILREFVKVSEENKAIYEKRAEAINNSKVYKLFIGLPLLFRDRAVLPKTHQGILHDIASISLERQALDLTEKATDRLDQDDPWKDLYYKFVAKKHLKKAKEDLSALETLKRIIAKISKKSFKDFFIKKIAYIYSNQKKFTKAFETVKKISFSKARFFLRLFIISAVSIHALSSFVKAILWPFKSIKNKIHKILPSSINNYSVIETITILANKILNKLRILIDPLTDKKFYRHLAKKKPIPSHPDSYRIYYSGFNGFLRKISHKIIAIRKIIAETLKLLK
ncbi:MAG: hypothetical protein K1060chlam1_00842 [Candidatus Anoxychlamydiales bacterium]|nr:hypothetical protein [Candidatus Anoxychlamydiales bacterium]